MQWNDSRKMKKTLAIILSCFFLLLCACSKDDNVNPDNGKDEPEKEAISPTKGEHRYLVILVETSDVRFSIPNPRQAFWDMLNKQGYSDYGGTGSARDYFIDQSNSLFKPVFDVYGPVTVDIPMSGFTIGRGLTKTGAQRLFATACDQLNATVDFSEYDSDGDNVIDNVFFYYAGYNSADGPDNAIWPHAGKVDYRQWSFDGKQLIDYACTSELKGSSGCEMARIGNFCHEFAHVLGLPDFYDTEMVSKAGPWDFSLMHNGCYNNSGNTPPSLNCEEKMMLGWLEAIPEVSCPVSGFELKPVSENGGAVVSTENPGEYFYLEYRNGKGWDRYLPVGMVIYHVDKSENMVDGKTAEFRWRRLFNINASPEHPCFDLIEASEDCVTFGNGVNSYRPVAWSDEPSGCLIDAISIGDQVLTFDVKAASSF